MDRNDYYGGEGASLNLKQLYGKFRTGMEAPQALGRDRDYNVDLVPKFMMAYEPLVELLRSLDVVRYLEFRQIEGSYVYRDKTIYKVPANEIEALSTSMIGFFQKRYLKQFFEFVHGWKADDYSTHQGLVLERNSMDQVYTHFKLDDGTRDFIGHSLALHLNDDYTKKPAIETIERILLYMKSMARFGKSPYIYPLYGLGELPQGFARLSAIYGGTYMLDKTVDEIVYENGVFQGVRSGNEVAKAKFVIGDPFYFSEKVRKVAKVIRSICLLKAPIPNTNNNDSAQVILPQSQLGRKHDIYIASLSSEHQVCAKGYYLAIVSTVVETDRPEQEIQPAYSLLGPIVEKFVSISDQYEPLTDGKQDQVFISRTFDATSHFVTMYEDVKNIYHRITGEELVLEARTPQE